MDTTAVINSDTMATYSYCNCCSPALRRDQRSSNWISRGIYHLVLRIRFICSSADHFMDWSSGQQHWQVERRWSSTSDLNQDQHLISYRGPHGSDKLKDERWGQERQLFFHPGNLRVHLFFFLFSIQQLVLAPPGTLVVMMDYYIWWLSHFSDFHSSHATTERTYVPRH